MRFFWKYVFPGVYGLVIYFTIRVVNDTMGKGFKFWDRPLYINVIEIASALFVGYVFVYALERLEKKHFNPALATVSVKGIIREFAIVILISIVIINVTITIVAAITDDGLSLADFVQINIIPTLYIIIYFAVKRGNYYIREFISSKIKLEQVENDRLNTELSFLKAQFNPHFLFNGLNNIYFLMDKSVPRAKEGIEKLSELLRYHLYQDQQKTVPLSKECAFIELYINVNRIRRKEDLVVDFRGTDSGCHVYPHLFIPLVENAFKYVDGKSPGIRLMLGEQNGRISFEIENTIRAHVGERHEGIGLKNLRRRLELLYGDGHTFEVKKTNDLFIATLHITPP